MTKAAGRADNTLRGRPGSGCMPEVPGTAPQLAPDAFAWHPLPVAFSLPPLQSHVSPKQSHRTAREDFSADVQYLSPRNRLHMFTQFDLKYGLVKIQEESVQTAILMETALFGFCLRTRN